MKLNIALLLMLLFVLASTNFSQTEITIKKKTSMKIPGMPEMPSMPGVKDPMKNRTSTTYIKGARMRIDNKYEQPKKMGGTQNVTQTQIIQCDKGRNIQFSSKKKKYFQDPIAGNTAANTKNSKKGGYITVTGGVTDTGERAKLFGYDARHLKETYTMTPSKGACQKEKMTIEIEGWYADISGFSCPAQRKLREFQIDQNCFDDVDFQIKGAGITGLALKEIKTIKMGDGQSIILEEEVISLTKGPISDALFDPPANYKAANTLKEVEDDSPDDSTSDTRSVSAAEMPAQTPASNSEPVFAPPTAGIERPATGAKRNGWVRIGIAKPKVTTPETKNDPEAGSDIAAAATGSLIEALKSENVEAVQLETDFAANEAAEKQCDYIIYANVTQKRGGGGMFGKMVAMGAISVVGAFIPGIGGLVASTVASQVMGQTMGKAAKAKDEFSLDYKVMDKDKAVMTQGSSKGKTDKDGDDILTPQLQKASAAVLAEIAKKRTP